QGRFVLLPIRGDRGHSSGRLEPVPAFDRPLLAVWARTARYTSSRGPVLPHGRCQSNHRLRRQISGSRCPREELARQEIKPDTIASSDYRLSIWHLNVPTPTRRVLRIVKKHPATGKSAMRCPGVISVQSSGHILCRSRIIVDCCRKPTINNESGQDYFNSISLLKNSMAVWPTCSVS